MVCSTWRTLYDSSRVWGCIYTRPRPFRAFITSRAIIPFEHFTGDSPDLEIEAILDLLSRLG